MSKDSSRNNLTNSSRIWSNKKIPRSRNGCWTCRNRKIKCDETHPKCTPCKRLNIECDYSRRLSYKDDTQRILKKMSTVIDTMGCPVYDSNAKPIFKPFVKDGWREYEDDHVDGFVVVSSCNFANGYDGVLSSSRNGRTLSFDDDDDYDDDTLYFNAQFGSSNNGPYHHNMNTDISTLEQHSQFTDEFAATKTADVVPNIYGMLSSENVTINDSMDRNMQWNIPNSQPAVDFEAISQMSLPDELSSNSSTYSQSSTPSSPQSFYTSDYGHSIVNDGNTGQTSNDAFHDSNIYMMGSLGKFDYAPNDSIHDNTYDARLLRNNGLEDCTSGKFPFQDQEYYASNISSMLSGSASLY
ncbi:hypothetical protein V1511DRAFT_398538 [Dipodascopsis uninucleata]